MLRKQAVMVAVVLAAVGALRAGTVGGSDVAPLEQVGVEVKIAAADSEEAIYQCTAVVKDLASDTVLSAPRILLRAGEEAQTRTATSSGLEVHIVVSVNEAESEAKYSASIHWGEKVISSQTVHVALGRP